MHRIKENWLDKLKKKVAGFVCHSSTFDGLMKLILGIFIAFEKKYKKKLVETRIVGVVNRLMDKDFLTGKRPQFH